MKREKHILVTKNLKVDKQTKNKQTKNNNYSFLSNNKCYCFFLVLCGCIQRFTIYVKAGEYWENAWVLKDKMNLMLVGDGIGKTILKGAKNVVDGSTTFQSATFGTFNSDFPPIFKDILTGSCFMMGPV